MISMKMHAFIKLSSFNSKQRCSSLTTLVYSMHIHILLSYFQYMNSVLINTM
jgi:hypothetical protein